MSEAVTTWPCDSVDLYEGEIITFKGRLDGLLSKSLALSFSDWSMVYLTLADNEVAQMLKRTFAHGGYVTVKAQVIDEDGTMLALAIWGSNCVPIPLAGELLL